jgi:hypothetical protein
LGGLQLSQIAVDHGEGFDFAARHGCGFRYGEGGFFVERIAGQAAAGQEVDGGPAAAEAVFAEGAEEDGGQCGVVAGAFAVDPGGEFGGEFWGVACEEGADRAFGVDAAGGVAGELAVDVEVDVAPRDEEGEGVPVELDAESAEGVDVLSEGVEGAAFVEVGPEDAGEALAGDAFAWLEDHEQQGGEELLGFGLDADVVDFDHAFAEGSDADHHRVCSRCGAWG